MLILGTANPTLTRTGRVSKGRAVGFFPVNAIQVETDIAAFKRKLFVQIWL